MHCDDRKTCLQRVMDKRQGIYIIFCPSSSFYISKKKSEMLVLLCPQGGTLFLSVDTKGPGVCVRSCLCILDILEKLLYVQKSFSGMQAVGNYNKIQWFVYPS